MKPPVKHDLIRDGDRLFRVLWCDMAGPMMVILEVSRSTGWPVFRKRRDVIDDLSAGALTYEPFKDPRDFRADTDLDALHIAYRDTAWNLIKNIVSDEPAVYHKNNRCKAMHDTILKHGITWRPLAQYLQSYWRGGMTKNALLPAFSNCGAKGRPRADTPVRRGRPRREGHPPGLNTSQEHRQYFSLAIRHYYGKNRKLTLNGAYEACIRLFFTDKIEGSNGRIEHVEKPEFTGRGFPSFGAFKYWVKQDRVAFDLERQRETPRVYDMKNRALLGSTTRQATGPAARYQIDATIADIYLVSSRDANQLIGRPVIYVIIDEFSRLITGLYIGLEGPSYVGAMMALANAVAPKKAFCASFGIDIEEEDWPAHHSPTALLADRGELEGTGIENALETFQIIVENTPPYRGDWKGLVESQFRTIHSGFKAYVPGYVESDFRQRGARDYRADAILTIEDFTKIIIDMILTYNNHHVLKNYERDPALTEDGVPSIPRDLWQWGIANVGGHPKSPAPELFRFALMRTENASVTEHGILFEKLYYTCDTATKEKWFEKARNKGRFPVKISYDKRDASRIYVHTPKREAPFDIARLAPKSVHFDGLSGWEIAGLQKTDALLHAKREMTEQCERAAFTSRMEQVVAEAGDRANSVRAPQSLSQRTRSVRSNRAADKAIRREKEAHEFRPDTAKPQAGVVVPFSSPEVGRATQYSKPSLSSLKREVEEENE